MRGRNKKGLSPVIATVLLVMLAVILALIIFMWARSFISEKITKDGEVIENSCGLVQFSAVIEGGQIKVSNDANVALYGVNVKRISESGIEDLGNLFTDVEIGGKAEESILPGMTSAVQFSPGDETGEVTYRITPVLLGINDKGERKAYTCDEQYSEDITPTGG